MMPFFLSLLRARTMTQIKDKAMEFLLNARAQFSNL
jgi:hypothetical protein